MLIDHRHKSARGQPHAPLSFVHAVLGPAEGHKPQDTAQNETRKRADFYQLAQLPIYRRRSDPQNRSQDIVGKERISKYLKESFKTSPYVSMLIDIFSSATWFICLLEEEEEEEEIKQFLSSISMNENLSDEQSLISLQKLMNFKEFKLSDKNIDAIVTNYKSTDSVPPPYKPKFFTLLSSSSSSS